MTETLTRDDIAEKIAALRAKQQRMPEAWVQRREEVAVEIERWVLEWLAAER